MTIPRPILALLAVLALPAVAAAQQRADAEAACPAPVRAAHDVLADGRTLGQAFDSLVARAKADTTGLALVPYDSLPRPLNGPAVARRFMRLFDRERPRTEVVLGMVVGSHGRVMAVEVVSHSDSYRFDRDAITALRQFRFRPALSGGCPVPHFSVLPVSAEVSRTPRQAPSQPATDP